MAIYVDFKLDESYTPQKISVRAGASFHDLKEIRVVQVEEPQACWIVVPLRPPDTSGRYCLSCCLLAPFAEHKQGLEGPSGRLRASS